MLLCRTISTLSLGDSGDATIIPAPKLEKAPDVVVLDAPAEEPKSPAPSVVGAGGVSSSQPPDEEYSRGVMMRLRILVVIPLFHLFIAGSLSP